MRHSVVGLEIQGALQHAVSGVHLHGVHTTGVGKQGVGKRFYGYPQLGPVDGQALLPGRGLQGFQALKHHAGAQAHAFLQVAGAAQRGAGHRARAAAQGRQGRGQGVADAGVIVRVAHFAAAAVAVGRAKEYRVAAPQGIGVEVEHDAGVAPAAAAHDAARVARGGPHGQALEHGVELRLPEVGLLELVEQVFEKRRGYRWHGGPGAGGCKRAALQQQPHGGVGHGGENGRHGRYHRGNARGTARHGGRHQLLPGAVEAAGHVLPQRCPQGRVGAAVVHPSLVERGQQLVHVEANRSGGAAVHPVEAHLNFHRVEQGGGGRKF